MDSHPSVSLNHLDHDIVVRNEEQTSTTVSCLNCLSEP